jgi:ubiquinol-cytochrome c reductase iron-sulfur subunit
VDSVLDEHSSQRRRFLIASTTAVGGAMLGATAYTFLDSMAPSAQALAAGAPVDASIAGIAPGELKVIAWRGMPVWLLHRGAGMVAKLGDHDRLLADPASAQSQQPGYCRNATRSIRPDVLVAVGVCTHLGCSPTLRADGDTSDLGPDWPGGFFCPCHGSKFDLAGRVFKDVPAPTNLVIPPHRFVDEVHLVVGENPSVT